MVAPFSHSKFEATHRVVEVKGSISDGQGTGADSLYSGQGSEVPAVAVLGTIVLGTICPIVLPATCTRQPLRILKPLDLGARQGKLGEEFVCLRTGDSFREVRHLQHPSQH